MASSLQPASRERKRPRTFNNRLPPVDPVVLLLSVPIVVSRLCKFKPKLRSMQKSGDRGCAGQPRSEVGTLIALM